MIRLSAIVVCVLLIGCIPRAAAAAAPGQSTLILAVKGAGVAGLTLDLQPSSKGTPGWTARLDAPRTAMVRNLPAESYEVVVTTGNGQATRWPIALEPDETATVEILVEATGPPAIRLVERARPTHASTFTRADLDALPAGGDLSAILDAAAPFVIGDRIDNGGIATGSWILAGNRGASWTTNTLVLGDLRTTNTALTRAWAMLPDLAAADRVAVVSGGLDATFAADGAAIVVSPRRTGQNWWRTIDTAGTSTGMVSDSRSTSAPPTARLNTFGRLGFDAGGPVGEHGSLFFAASQNRSEWFDRGGPDVISSRASSFFTSIAGRLTDRDALRVQAAVQQLERPFDGRQQFLSGTVPERDTLGHAVATWIRRRGDSGVAEYAVAFERTAATPRPSDASGGSVDRILDGLVPAPAASTTLTRINGRAAIDFGEFGSPTRRHDLRAGVEIDYGSHTSAVIATPAVAELINGLPARVWIPQQPSADAHRHVSTVSAFASDRLVLATHVTMEVGVRAMFSSGAADGSGSTISASSIAPRVSLRWGGPAGAMVASYGRYQSPLPVAYLAFGDPNATLTRIYRWADGNKNQRFDVGEDEALVALTGANQSIASVDGNLTLPRTDEFALSGEAPLGTHMRLRGSMVTRRSRDLVRSVNVGAPLSSYRPVQVFDAGPDDTGAGAAFTTIYERLPSTFGQDRYLLTNPDGDRATYGGIEAAWELQTARWSSMAGAMAYRTFGWGANRGYRVDENDQGAPGERFETPNATPVENGRLFFDRAYVLKWSTSYRPGRGFLLASTARYQDGQAFGRLVVAPVLAQGADFITVDRVGDTRFTFLATIDARFGKTFSWGRRQAGIALDVFNISNRANEVEEHVVAGVGFRATSAVQPPRAMRLSVKFTF
jgi:hypothetical protein